MIVIETFWSFLERNTVQGTRCTNKNWRSQPMSRPPSSLQVKPISLVSTTMRMPCSRRFQFPPFTASAIAFMKACSHAKTPITSAISTCSSVPGACLPLSRVQTNLDLCEFCADLLGQLPYVGAELSAGGFSKKFERSFFQDYNINPYTTCHGTTY